MNRNSSTVRGVVVSLLLAIWSVGGLAFKQGDLHSDPNHQLITESALDKSAFSHRLANWKSIGFQATSLYEIKRHNQSTDHSTVHFYEPEFHMDEERFATNEPIGADGLPHRSSVVLLKKNKDAIVRELRSPYPNIDLARRLLGFSLHTIQDFFAHSSWVEINRERVGGNLLPLKVPAFGESDPFSGIGLFLETELPSKNSTCTASGRTPFSPLTSGYYDNSQSLLVFFGHDEWMTDIWVDFYSKHGEALKAGGLVAGAGFLRFVISTPYLLVPAGTVGSIAVLTTYKTDYQSFQSDLGSGLLDASLFWEGVFSPSAEYWPHAKCTHGADHGAGLNKDNVGRDEVAGAGAFAAARDAAMQASREFVGRILKEVQEFDRSAPLYYADGTFISASERALLKPTQRNRGICALLGHVPSSDCDLPTETAIVNQLSAQQYPGSMVILVSGSNLTPGLQISLSDAACVVSDLHSSSTAATFFCKPPTKPGIFDLEAREYSGAPRILKSVPIEVKAAFVSTSSTSFNLLQRITVLFDQTLDAVSSIVLTKISPALAELGTEVIKVVDNVAKWIVSFAQSGKNAIIAEFKDITGSTLGFDRLTVFINKSIVTEVVIPPVLIGQRITFVVTGENLVDGLKLILVDCANSYEEELGGSSTRRRYSCIFPEGISGGLKSGHIATSDNPFAGEVLKEFAVAVATPAALVSGITASPSPVVGQSSVITVSGSNLPSTSVLVVVDANCDANSVKANAGGTGFTETCTFGQTTGSKQVTVMSSTAASSFVIDDTKTLQVGAAPSPVPVVNPANGHSYELIECGTWTGCRDAARAKGGELVTIRSKAESDWLIANMLSKARTDLGVWIGLTDEAQEGVWRWVSGEPVTFTNWRVGEPNNRWLDGRTEAYGHMWRGNATPTYDPGVWNDIVNEPVWAAYPSSAITQAIVEYPRPASPLVFTERPDTGSGWNLRVTVTPKDANGHNGTFDFGRGQCTGTLTYEGKDGGGNYMFQENHLTGGCWRTCKIAIAPDAGHYNERCTGGPYNGSDIAPANRRWLDPWPTSSQLDSLLPPSAPLRDLVGYWTLDDCALGTGRAADSSVMRREAQYGAICVAGMRGSALQFQNPGTNTYGGSHSMHLPVHTSAAITFSAWVKWLGDLQSANTYGTAGALWSIGTHTTEPFMSIWINEGGIAADGGKIWTDRFPNSTYQLKRDEWTMVSIASDGTSETLYLNGEPINTSVYPRAVSYQGFESYVSKHFWGTPGVGRSDWAARFRGVVDDVRLYGRSLSGSEIRELYNATR
ncbi:MAG: LamG-like jellyroll fold domain-containing protein [Burkholderiaceae bacterium]